jgi:hypothetical protein
MDISKEYAARATASLAKLLRPDADPAEVAAVIERTLDEAAGARGKRAEASAQARTAQLLSASPAVIYSFRAREDFARRRLSATMSKACSAITRASISTIRISGRSTSIRMS